MKHEIIINNYQKGSCLRMTPTHKIVSIEKIDNRHHKVIYEDLTKSDVCLIEKAFAKKLKEC